MQITQGLTRVVLASPRIRELARAIYVIEGLIDLSTVCQLITGRPPVLILVVHILVTAVP